MKLQKITILVRDIRICSRTCVCMEHLCVHSTTRASIHIYYSKLWNRKYNVELNAIISLLKCSKIKPHSKLGSLGSVLESAQDFWPT